MAQSARPQYQASLALQIGYFIRLGRPLHLVGGLVFNGLGIAIAGYLGVAIRWPVAIWCQLIITSTQLMTHFSNDYFDQDADAATVIPTRWAGGSRVLPEGLIHPRGALIAAVVCGGLALAVIAGLAFRQDVSPMTIWLFLLAVFLAWSYSSPPLWLNRHGLGEITGAILVPGITTLLGFMAQAGKFNLIPVLAAVPLVFIQFAMLVSVNFPDFAGDTLVNKRTLVVIVGPERGARLFAGSLFLAYLLLPLLVMAGLPLLVAISVLPMLPIAVWQGWRIHNQAAIDPTQWNALAFWSIGLLIGSALLETAAFLVGSRTNRSLDSSQPTG
ncbi:MAG: prenyltransferase [Chloroflexota bacterium]